ncbi:MAG: hypothetical protein R2690_15255 [Acidimicrobiales bacterium]
MSDGGSIGDSDALRPGAVLVLAGGGAVDRTLLATLLTPVDGVPVVIAADSGALLAASVAVPVHHLVGDLDSLVRRRSIGSLPVVRPCIGTRSTRTRPIWSWPWPWRSTRAQRR